MTEGGKEKLTTIRGKGGQKNSYPSYSDPGSKNLSNTQSGKKSLSEPDVGGGVKRRGAGGGFNEETLPNLKSFNQKSQG